MKQSSEELEWDKKTGIILMKKHNASNGYEEVEIVPSRQKQPQQNRKVNEWLTTVSWAAQGILLVGFLEIQELLEKLSQGFYTKAPGTFD